MCGIAGVVYRVGADGLQDSSVAVRLSTALSHRGPDGAGVWCSGAGDAVLVHRRLAIIDPTPGGAQPMLTPDGRSAIVFNGEVYNYRELRESLEGRGERFSTGSDTEVLLRLVACDGPQALARVRGMFALAYWDERERSLLLARDRFGIKPLYITRSGDRLAWASEIGALRAAGLIDGRPSEAGVLAFLSWGSVPAPLTWHCDVEMLSAGIWRRWWQDGRTTGGRFADTRTAYQNERTRSRPAAAFREDVAAAVRGSVRAHLVADVPVGVFLSGGIDSSALVSAARSAGSTNLQTFTVGFDDRSSEIDHARTVSRLFSTEHHDVHLDAPDVAADWPRILARLDQPTADAVNSFYVSQAVAATGIKAVLSGVGGDELFGGYPSFGRLPRAMAAKRMLGPIFPLVAPVATPWLPERLRPRWRHFATVNGHVEEAYRVQRGFLLPEEIRGLAGPRLLEAHSTEALARVRRVEQEVCAPEGPESTLAAVARLETRMYLGSQLLRDIDAMSMAHGLEVRVPFVDHELLDCVWPELGAHPDLVPGKKLLVETLNQPLPASIVSRPKQGFTLPMARWMATSLRPVVTDGLDLLARDGWLAAAAPSKVWNDWQQGAAHWTRPWGLAVLGHFLNR